MRPAIDKRADGPYQLLPPFSDDEYAGLVENIATFGILHPVTVDEDGNILDGHHRWRAAQDLEIDWDDVPKTVLAGLSEEEKVEQVLLLNLARRHLTPGEKREVVRKLREKGLSLRFISEKTGIPYSTTRRYADGVTPGEYVGRDGKTYRARTRIKAAHRDLEWEEAVRTLNLAADFAYDFVDAYRKHELWTAGQTMVIAQAQSDDPATVIPKAARWVKDRLRPAGGGRPTPLFSGCTTVAEVESRLVEARTYYLQMKDRPPRLTLKKMEVGSEEFGKYVDDQYGRIYTVILPSLLTVKEALQESEDRSGDPVGSPAEVPA